jgi:hypothetical protein
MKYIQISGQENYRELSTWRTELNGTVLKWIIGCKVEG